VAGNDQHHPLSGIRVLDLSSGVPGGYCTKLLADGGADVVKLEPPGGDSLRHWAIGARLAADEDGALWEFLGCSKRSALVDTNRPRDLRLCEGLLARADMVVWSPGPGLAAHASWAPAALHARAPGAIVAAITPFGVDGPWAGRPATDLTLQAWSGGIAPRGRPERAPVQCGGRPGDWLAGLFAAVGLLTAWQRTVVTGQGELLDVSQLEALVLTQSMYPVTARTMRAAAGLDVPDTWPVRSIFIPAIEQTRDGWVGFMVATPTMWESFCVMVGHPEWIEDERLYSYAGRAMRRDELEKAITSWVSERTTAEVLEACSLLRVPAAPVGDGSRVTSFDHLVERRFFVANPRTGVLQPDVPYTLGAGGGRRPPEPAPLLGEHTEDVRTVATVVRGPGRAGPPDAGGAPLPFAGLRVADFTAFWAGPIVGHYLAMLGADVIHVESAKRPDGIRSHTVRTVQDDQWWEWAAMFHGPNTNKRDVTIDMDSDRGRELARRLIARCDVMIENYSPRVVEQWGLDYPAVRQLRPDIVCVRMPAFGLTGPWRDRTGYAQNMEQASGMAWMTGYPDGPPIVPNGMCDPLSGTHATFALLLALEHRRRTGEGMLVEVAMIGGALNVAAEQVLEFGSYGSLLTRDGNRGPTGAPQGLYPTADRDSTGRRDGWIAIAVETDEQWRALGHAVGDPPWAADARLSHVDARRAAHNRIDQHLSSWCAARSADEIVDALWAAGVPVAKVLDPQRTDSLPQLAHRGFFEVVQHPVTGPATHCGYPVRFSSGPTRLHRTPAPTLGQHNREVLGGLLGLGDGELEELARDQVIGTALTGSLRAR
jgi:crotonobetainyl-CoA:carnitine CoA-transferase CaiB-like acyl-CoA transferase